MHISLFRPQALLHLTHLTFHTVILFHSFDEMCVAASIATITSNATGLDGIPLVFIKLLLSLMLLLLTQLFNFILTCSTLPFVWKISNVVPIPKVNSPTEI
jgi:hypothetical protein